jgi:hypothetical protein
MKCTAHDERGLFDCDCCLISALDRIHSASAFNAMMKDTRQRYPEQYERVRPQVAAIWERKFNGK